MLKRTLILSAALTAFAATPALAADTTLTIKNFVGKVEILPGSKIEVLEKDNIKDVDFDRSGDSLTIDGNINDPDGNDCKGYYGRGSWSFFSKKESRGDFGGYEDLDDYPDLVIAVPEDVELVIYNSIPFGTVSDIGSADIEMSFCGNLQMEDINGPAEIEIRGSGDLSAGNVQEINASVRGSGDLSFENATNATISVRGSGDVTMNNADNADITVSGSGDVEVGDISSTLKVTSSGSGDVSVESVGKDLYYEGRGSTDFELNDLSGNAEISISGSGDVDIDDGNVDLLIVTARGSSGVDFDGTAQTADLKASGASDIYVDRVVGKSETRESGAADIKIGS